MALVFGLASPPGSADRRGIDADPLVDARAAWSVALRTLKRHHIVTGVVRLRPWRHCAKGRCAG